MSVQRFLGFDYGTKLIGVAVGGTALGEAQALTTIVVNHGKPDWPRLDNLLKEWQPHGFVLGLPLNMDGTDTDATAPARKFGHQLQGRYNLPVHWVDERLSSVAAKAQLEEAGISPVGRNKAEVDKQAARLILQNHLDQLPRQLS
ncbi:MAG: Holliday junction resolvase RuvX [Gammaproteobacteria bacterium]|nr:MAG: Holliday junction resolvase RuvX [Gammaproteobacteria bacterium]